MNRQSFASNQSPRPKVDRSASATLFFSFSKDCIINLVRCGASFTYIMTNDVKRLTEELSDILTTYAAEKAEQVREQRQYMTFQWASAGLLFSNGKEFERADTYYGTEKAATLLNSMKNFLTVGVPAQKRLDADAYNIILNADDIFKDPAALELLAKAIPDNESENTMIRKMFFVVGSTPYLPSSLNGLACFIRHDYGAEAPVRKLIDTGGAQEVLANSKEFCENLKFPYNASDDEVLSVIKDLTAAEADNIISYVMISESGMDAKKLRRFSDSLDLQNKLFSFVG